MNNKNLAIDIGNTRIKIGVFKNDQLQDKFVWSDWDWKKLLKLATNQMPQNIILSTVNTEVDEKIEDFFKKNYFYIRLNAGTPLPFLNSYKSPETLGKDRLAGIAGAWSLFPDQNSLVIDAGTCITFDIITTNGNYIGGNISPGIAMRYRAMHEFTARLPLAEKKFTTDLIGTDTNSALQIGGSLGTILEMDGLINLFKVKFDHLNVILTGGDADFFVKKLENKIFVDHNLILVGLNQILRYNVECSY